MLEIFFTKAAEEDFEYWIKNDRKTLDRIKALIVDCQRSPFSGIGKPEPLKGNLSGWWSRRINLKDRMVYKVQDSRLIISSIRRHY